MTASYRIDTSLGVVFTTADGVLTAEDVERHRETLRQDPDFDPGFNQLIDLRDVVEFGISAGDIAKVSRNQKLFGKGSRRAIVTATDLSFGLARMFEMHTDVDSGEVRVFRDVAEARRWLGLE